MHKGPRLIIKADWTKNGQPMRGCHLTQGNTRPEVWAIAQAAMATAPVGLDVVEITEGHREIRDTLDFHELNGAFDFSLRRVCEAVGLLDDVENRKRVGDAWAARMQVYLHDHLGPFYDVECHGDGWNIHIHGELHP